MNIAGKTFSDLFVCGPDRYRASEAGSIAFLVFGFGLQVATTAYYALLADTVGEEHIGKVTGAAGR